jgi:Carboxypeptidase regulatory-like domain
MKTLGILSRHILFGLTLLVLGHGTMSLACSCIRQTTCGVHRYLDADFVGEVLSRRVMPSDDKPTFDSVLFQVRVIESFRGTEKVGEVVGIRTGFGGGDCGYRFKIGAKYLVDASRNGDGFITGICSLTAPIQNSEVELRSLRRLAVGQRLPDLVGVLMRGTETDDGENVTPLSGVSVRATPVAGGSSQATATDAVGSFTFEKLPAGKYELILGLPANLSAAYTDTAILDEDQIPSVSIESRDADSTACHTLIVVKEAGGIGGVVQSNGSTKVDGWVNADTVTADDKPWNTVRNVIPRPDGNFFLPNLKLGRYSLTFISRAGFVRGKPQIIELKDGERRTGILLSQ